MAAWDAARPCAGTAAGGRHLHPSQAAVRPLLSPHQGQSCRHWGLALCPPPPVWCTHGAGGPYTCCWQQGVGGKVKLPSLRGTCVLGGECVWEKGSSVCKSQGKKTNQNKAIPLGFVSPPGAGSSTRPGVQSSRVLVLPSLAPAAAGAWPEPAWALACSGTPLTKPVWSKLFTSLGWG